MSNRQGRGPAMWRRRLNARCEAYRSAVTCLILLTLLGSFVRSAKADADQEQCSCNLQVRGLNKVGSKTVNAAACVRHQFQSWCDIYVSALENTAQHRNLVVAMLNAGTAGTPAAGTALFSNLFDSYANAVAATSPGLAGRLRSDGEKLKSLTNDANNARLITKCIDDFRMKEAVSDRETQVSCSVGEVSKWLSVTFEIEDSSYTFLLAPTR